MPKKIPNGSDENNDDSADENVDDLLREAEDIKGHPAKFSKQVELTEIDVWDHISIPVVKDGFDPMNFGEWAGSVFDHVINLYYQKLAKSNHEDFVENVGLLEGLFIGKEQRHHVATLVWTLKRDLNTDKELVGRERITCYGLFFSAIIPNKNSEGYTVTFEKIFVISARFVRYERETYFRFIAQNPKLGKKIEYIYNQFDIEILPIRHTEFTFLSFARNLHIDAMSGNIDTTCFGSWLIALKNIHKEGEPESIVWRVCANGKYSKWSDEEGE